MERPGFAGLAQRGHHRLLVMVKVQEDGSVFWNMMQLDPKGMNALRLGELQKQKSPDGGD